MKELSRKVFFTIFVIFTLFIVFSISFINIQNYKREYESVRRSLNIIEEDEFKKNKPFFKDNDNMRILDYEVYTIKIEDNKIDKVISHGNESSNFNINNIAKKIISDNDKDNIKIGNLYFNKYSYSYKYNESIVILNSASINKKLTSLLLSSILIFICIDILIYIISKNITKWIIKPAKEAFDKQRDFIADASHELKTPLAVIMASSDEIESNGENSKYIENIKFESEKMNNLIKNMLELSKLESGVLKSTYKEENLSKIVLKICSTFEAIAYEKQINIITNIKDDIYLNCSKEDIEKVISIIIDNAIKHSYKNKDINVNLYSHKNNISIEIINIGDGIKKEDENKIFERFYRSDKSRNREDNRYGLGLAIAKNIVLNHNGIIKAYTKDEKTIFKLEFKK